LAADTQADLINRHRIGTSDATWLWAIMPVPPAQAGKAMAQDRNTISGTRERLQPQPPPTEPHNPAVEIAVISAIMADNEYFQEISSALAPIDFHGPMHGQIYAAIASLISEGRPADPTTVAPKLRELNVGDVKIIDFVATLPLEKLPREKFIGYAEEIMRYSIQRVMIETGKTLMQTAYSKDAKVHDIAASVGERLESAVNRIKPKRITQRSIGEYARMAIDNYKDPNKPKGIKTKLADFDSMTGGLFRGELSLLGGRPSMGKTVAATQIALNAAKSNYGVLYLSLEMDGEAMAQRVLTSESFTGHYFIPYTRFRSDALDERDLRLLDGACGRIQKTPLRVETHASMTLAQVSTRVRQLRAEWEAIGQSLDLLVIDYLTLLKFSDRWKGQRVYEVAELSTGLKEMARTFNIHVMAVHQLSRSVEQRDDKRPQMSDLRESGQLEQDADLILLCYRDAYYLERTAKSGDAEAKLKADEARNEFELLVAKQRMGAVGTLEFYCEVAANVIRNKGQY
jgi:replicative DNA helicase